MMMIFNCFSQQYSGVTLLQTGHKIVDIWQRLSKVISPNHDIVGIFIDVHNEMRNILRVKLAKSSVKIKTNTELTLPTLLSVP